MAVQRFKQSNKMDPALILEAYDTAPDQSYILAIQGPGGEDLGGLRDITNGIGLGIDAGQAGLYAPASAPFCASAQALCVANRSEYVRFVCPKSQTITKVSFCVYTAATADDPCDVGIFSGTTLLGSSGPTTGKLNVQGQSVVNLAAGVPLIGGQVYHAAFAYGPVGGTAATLLKTVLTASGAAQLAALFGASPPQLEQGYWGRYPLASGGFIAGLDRAPIMALLQ